MKGTLVRNLILIFGCIILGVGGQLCIKEGIRRTGIVAMNLANAFELCGKALTTPFILLGFLFYIISTFIWLSVLSRVQLSFAYPLISFGYVLTVFFSWLLLNESVSLIRWLGVMVICCGVFLISRS